MVVAHTCVHGHGGVLAGYSRQAKVTQAGLAVMGQQDVVRLQVAMNDATTVMHATNTSRNKRL